MNTQQECHLTELKKSITTLMDAKYRAGQAAHGGNLFDMTVTQLIMEAINENIDQATYLLTALEILNGITDTINGPGVDESGYSGRNSQKLSTPAL
jgi:hypothetical protein